MKKVWILEKFASREEMETQLKTIYGFLQDSKTADEIRACNEMIENYKRMILENPNGHWYGFEGKIVYKQFIQTAKEAMRRNPDGIFRVVEGLIEDDATMWPGYKFVRINEKVLAFLGR